MIFAQSRHDITSQFWGSGSLRGATNRPSWQQQSAEQKIMITKCRSWIAALVVLIYLVAISTSVAGAPSAPVAPKNIILFIGDGMGVAHITAAKTINSKLHLEQFRTTGLLTTHSHNAYITESASAATALATGVKTSNYSISMSPDGTPLKTIVEIAQEHGKSTGLVTTSRITHATPACFAAHVEHRDNEDTIAEHLADSSVDVLFGGGLAFFLPASNPKSKRSDNKDLIASLKKTHRIVTRPKQFRRLGTAKRVVGLLSRDHLPPAEKRAVTLAEMTQMAIKILSKNSNGFFLMVEGAQIDWGGHRRNSDMIVRETIDFDLAIGAGLAFAKVDQSTLVIVTADHESGGYALLGGSIAQKKITKTSFATRHHTAEMVPVFAFGPGGSVFGGIHDNTFVGKKMIEFVRTSALQNYE